MQSKVVWKSGLSFTGSSESGFEVALGTDPAVGGANDGSRPMELLAIGLAGCTAMDVISILTKKRQQITSFEVRMHNDRASEHPKVFTSATIEYLISGHEIDEASVLRALELSATRYCPAQAMFARLFPIGLKYSIFEDQDGKQTLVKSSSYTIPEK